MRSSHRFLLAAVLITAALIYLLPRLGSPPESTPAETQTADSRVTPDSSLGKNKTNPMVTTVYDDELIQQLHNAKGDARSEVNTLHKVILQYQQLTGEPPVGENEEITRELSGRNAKGIAVIPEGHPAINNRGELTDRWGSPYFFHAVSRKLMEIRSAGPDRKYYTEDDIVHP